MTDATTRACNRIAKARETGQPDLDLSRLGLRALPPEIGALAALKELRLDGNQLKALPPEIGALAALEWLSLNVNQLTALPPEIGALAALKVLTFGGNQLTALPLEIGALAALKTLSLNVNQLTALPPEIGSLAALKVLDLDSNQLTALPPEIGALAALKELRLDGNQLTALPPEIGALAALEVLLLGDNQLMALPPEIDALAVLQILSLNGNQLTALPPEIGALAALEMLRLTGNQLTALPPEIAALAKLERLDLNGNQLTALPPEIAALAALKTLDLNGNQLTALPPEIAALAALKTLTFGGNQLTALPPEIGALAKLEGLSLGGNQLTALPPEIGALAKLERLILTGNQLTALPPEIAALAALKTLILTGNQLTALPPEIGALAKLERLDLNGNQLTALPPEIAALAKLEWLDLNGNQLTALPPEIGAIAALERLDLDGNQLMALPPEIGALAKLERLDLNGSQLTALPPEIGALAALKTLTFGGNQLTALPPEIGALAKLEVLLLNGNQLTALPPEIGALAALETLILDDNPLPRAVMDAWEDGIANLFAVVGSLAKDTAPIFEAKLLITGEGQVGKSWALAALRREDPRATVGEGNTTWGIDRGELPLPHPKNTGTEIHLNTWDFGGQAIYRVTHQFFFSEQALFLLVWNPRMGATQCRVREWLRAIALCTGSAVPRGAARETPPQPRARVIMVATHAKETGGTYNPDYGHDSLDADLRAMIADSLEIDSATDYNVEKLRDTVANYAADLPDMGSLFNRRWAAARDAALALRHDHPWITFGDFAKICREHGVPDANDHKAIASTFMNRLGRAVWYGGSAEEADTLLGDTLILDAVWLSRAFVQVLEDEPTGESGGMLDHQRFRDIWTDHGRPKWHKYAPEEYERITRMMRRFDVALPTRASDGQRSLVPLLVPTHRPAALPWTKPEDASGPCLVRLACRLDHPAEGLMARFIAATEPYHIYQDGGGGGLFWQEGVFLRDSSFNNEALVTVEGTEKPLVSIDVSGNQPGFLMSELYKTLESVIGFWKGMTRTDYILCPTEETDGSYCGGKIKFDTVRRRLAKNFGHEVDCQDCDGKWDPKDLLSGLKAVRDRREADHQSAFLYQQGVFRDQKDRIPCPRTFLLRPADSAWFTSWTGFVGKRFHLTLISELSGKEVASKEFSIPEEWTKWLGPVIRIASLALTGLALPLDGDIAAQLSKGAATMDKLGALPDKKGNWKVPDDMGKYPGVLVATDEQLHKLHRLLKSIDLDPRENGMDLAETREGSWLWMTVEEAKAHARPEAKIGPKPSTGPVDD